MKREPRTSIIDTLSSGYGLINRWPLLLAPPILLDLFLWFGPRLSVQAPLLAAADLLVSQGEASDELVAIVRQAAGQSDLFALLAIQLPSMMRLLSPATTPLAGSRPLLDLTDPALALGVGLLLALAGFLLAMVYLVPIARVVRDGRPGLTGAASPIWRSWLRLLALVLLLAGGLVALAIPLALVTAVLALGGLPLGPVVLFAAQVAAIWLVVYLFFVIDAIVVSEVGPLRAIRYSVAVVRHNFWSALGLILLTLIISLGLPEVFKAIARLAAGVPVAIVANAYINTGLAAASMLFYRERLARWQQQQRAAALSRVGPGAPR
jgi:hypothetical protein